MATKTDDRDGYFVNLEEGPVRPVTLTADTREVWAVNLPDASVAVFSALNPLNLVKLGEVKVGLGPVAIVERPAVAGNGEMWVVCQSSNAVVIVDRTTRRILDSIRLPGEPVGLAFDPSGLHAWVTLSAADQVVEINAVTRKVANTLEFGAPFPGAALVHSQEPRSLLLDGSDLYVLSFESGNGTFGLTGGVITDIIDNLWKYYDNGTSPLPPPDRDLFRFPVPGAGAASVALWRAGSINLDLERDGNGEIWISNVDYSNHLVGEFQFPSALTPIARHRLTHAPPLAPGATAPQTPPPSVDLNLNALSTLKSQGYSCSMPNQMAFSASFQTLYVACYETHNVAVVDLSGPPQVVASLSGLSGIPGRHQNFGVRGLALHPTAGALYTYSRDNRLQVYSVPVASNTMAAPVQTLAIGFDITSSPVREGRFLNIDARRAANKVQSCNTCHVDGHLDRLAWDLSDFTGDGHAVGRVPKGTKVTMSLRGIEETPPFHWRGDRSDLAAFNPAFSGLLGGTQLSPSEMKAFESFVFSLSYPPNPRQPLSRTYSAKAPLPDAQQGAHAFRCITAHKLGFDDHPISGPPPNKLLQEVSCQFCHGMNGSSGTNNQVNNDIEGLLADDATQLRGLFDKESDVVDYSAFGFPAPVDHLPATGWGFGNTGFADSVADFVNLQVFQQSALTQPDRDDIVQFLAEFDSGLAPATGYAWTLNRAAALSPPFDTFLQTQAGLGHADLAVRGWMAVGGVPRNVSLQYNPGTTQFESDTTGLGPFSFTNLVNTAAANRGVFLFVGTPRGMGYRLGRDSEMDYALDGDEAAAGAKVGVADTDGDGFPDGYEMRLGSNPGSAGSLPPLEAVPPVFTTAASVAWTNTSLAKVRWQTGEEATSRIEVFQGATLISVKEDLQLKKEHVLVVRGLQPGPSYTLVVKSADPRGNVGTVTLPVTTGTAFEFEALHLASAQLQLPASPVCGAPVPLTAAFTVVDNLGNPVPWAEVDFTIVEWVPGSAVNTVSTTQTTGLSGSSGVATLAFTSGHNACAGLGARLEVFATAVREQQPPPPAPPIVPRLYFHPLDGQFGFWAEAVLP